MDNNDNALAELAEELGVIHDVANRGCTYETKIAKAVRKAQRIVSELAKMFTKSPEGKTCLDIRAPWCPPLEKCRAIAEE